MSSTPYKISRLRKIVYGVGCLGDGGWFQLLSAFLLYFYVDEVHLDPWLASIAFAISFGVWNAINDPIIGNLSDRTRTRWGRRRPWIAIGAPLCFLLSIFIWTPPLGGNPLANPHSLWMLFYMLVIIAASELAYTMCAVPYLSLYPETFTGVKERSEVVIYRQIFGVVGSMLAIVGFPLLVDSFSEELGTFGGWTWAGGVIGAIFMGSFLIGGVLGGKERKEFTVVYKPLGFVESLKTAVTNRSLLAYEGAHVMTFCMFGWLSAMMPFFVEHVLKEEISAVSIVLGLNMLGIFAFIVIWRKFCIRYGAKKILGASMITFTLSLMLALVVRNVVEMAVMGFLSGATIGGTILSREVIFGDIIDEDEVRSGVRREGVLIGIIVSLEKLSLVIIGVCMAFVLSFIGYVSGLEPPDQPPSVGLGIRLGMVGFTVIFLIVALISIKFYPLTKEKIDEIGKKLEKIRAEKIKKLEKVRQNDFSNFESQKPQT